MWVPSVRVQVGSEAGVQVPDPLFQGSGGGASFAVACSFPLPVSHSGRKCVYGAGPRPTEGRRGSGGGRGSVPRGSFSGYFGPRLSVRLRGMAIRCRRLGGICSRPRGPASHPSLSPRSTRIEAGHRDLLARPPFLPWGLANGRPCGSFLPLTVPSCT